MLYEKKKVENAFISYIHLHMLCCLGLFRGSACFHSVIYII